jgi:photosystem II stability/assembly factor-like uncharacterized protein
MRNKVHFIFVIFATTISLFLDRQLLFAQPIVENIYQNDSVSFRGLSVVNDSVLWVSGTKGTIGFSIDAGEHFTWRKIPSCDSIDFRDIEAFSKEEAVVMGIGSPAKVYKTKDGGLHWKQVFVDHRKEMFLDAMDFIDDTHGMLLGDPMDSIFFLRKTNDGGETWQEFESTLSYRAIEGEACFASSGSNLRMLTRDSFYFVSGGTVARLHGMDTTIHLPILQGKSSTGANAIDYHPATKRWFIVGGDFSDKDKADSTMLYSIDGGKTWQFSFVSGYRSSIQCANASELICCGLNGVDYSSNAGLTWINISKQSFHVCKKAKQGKVIFLAGGKGYIAQVHLEEEIK